MEIIEQAKGELAASGKDALIAPEAAWFRGAERGYGRVKRNGVMWLLPDALGFIMMNGNRIDLPLSDVACIETDKWFLKCYRNGYPHLIFNASDGNRIGFFVADIEKWKSTLANAGVKMKEAENA
ncbi:MAG: hypothetical protein JXR97_05400 [Planctomycetes bacterium]|nr:hypothetical protein [Planctomycetota bacterium]